MKGLKEMKKTFKTVLAGLLMMPLLAVGVTLFTPVAPSVSAQSIQEGADISKSDSQPADINVQFKNIVNIALYIIGAVSVLMLIYGGIRYTVSGGDTAAVTAAKNTILYAVVGIVVALLAYAIVNFVIGSFTP